MEHLSTWTETEGGKVLTMGKEAIPRGGTVDSEEELRNELIELISVGNLKYKPPGRERRKPCGAVTISDGYAGGTLMPPHGYKSLISSPPMTIYTMFGFNGTATLSCCSLTQRWLKHCQWNTSANKPAT